MAHIRKTFLKRSQTTVVWNPQLHFPGKYCLWASSVVLCNVSQMKCQGGNIFEDCWRFPVAKLCPTLCDPMVCSTCPSPTPGVTQTHVHWVGDAIQPYHSLLSPSPALNLPSIRVFFNELAPCIRWPEYWSFSFSIILGLHTGKRLMLPFSRQNSSVAHDSAIYMQLHLKLEQSLVTLSHTPGVSFNQFWAYQPDFKWPVPASHQKATLGLSRKSQSRGIWELFFCASPHPLSSFWPVSDGHGCINTPAPLPGVSLVPQLCIVLHCFQPGIKNQLPALVSA